MRDAELKKGLKPVLKAYKKTSVGMCSRQRYITMKEEGYRKYGCRGI